MAVPEIPPDTGRGAWLVKFVAECVKFPGEWMKCEIPVSPGNAATIRNLIEPPGQWESVEKGEDRKGGGAEKEGRAKSVWLYARYTAPLDGNKGEDGASGAV